MNIKQIADRYQTAMNMVYRGINNILKERIHSDVTTDQFSTLQYIQKSNQCTSTDIANYFGIGKSAVTAQITRLHDKRLLERIRDQKDRRIVYLKLTSKGMELIERIEKELYEILGRQLSHFNHEEVMAFIQSLEKLAQIMDEQ